MEALTTIPASLLGVSNSVGSLEAGKWANFLITNGPIFADKTVLIENWIQGSAYGISTDSKMELAGKYKLTLGNQSVQLSVTGETGSYKAQLFGKDTLTVEFSHKDQLVNLTFNAKSDQGKRRAYQVTS